jgi:glycine/D-amino acid oxidase-like deaminating enzyme
VHLQQLLLLWRTKLAEMNLLVGQNFDMEAADIGQHSVQFADITAEKVIFCDGVASILNPFFQLLPFAPNKGEALIIKAEGLTNEHVFKKGMLLVPFGNDNLYWVGSSYQWAFDNDQPSTLFLDKTTALLKQWLKVPFQIETHKAAVRPATLERRPFVGFHPLQNNVGILNGMGTKGSSLAPFFAHQLVQHLVYGFPIAK